MIETTSPAQLIAFLQEAPPFNVVDAGALAELTGRFRSRRFQAKEPLLHAGEPNEWLHFVESGTVLGLVVDETLQISFPVMRFRRGGMFGVNAFIPGQIGNLTAIAESDGMMHSLHLQDLDWFCLRHPDVARRTVGLIAEKLTAIAKRAGICHMSLRNVTVDREVIGRIPRAALLRNQTIPIGHTEWGVLLAMVDPGDLPAMDEMRQRFPKQWVYPAMITAADFAWFMETVYPTLVPDGTPPPAPAPANGPSSMNLLMKDILQDLTLAQATEDPTNTRSVPDLAHSAEDPPIIRLSSNILALAIEMGASDIHVEPQEEAVLLRFRVDGELQEEQRLPKALQLPLLSRLKIIANLDIAEHRLPQDGRISVRTGDRTVDFRVSTMPAMHGETIVMRLLDKSHAILGLDQLITHPATCALVRDMIAQPYGIIFVTGPTGSGKTTTLYSALSDLNKPGVNICTAEDPVEYELPRINQVQVKKEIGLDFARVLRAFLRQDPDIILVGETRDLETAKTSIEASLTGHLVFTTLHTNNAAASVTRLEEMGVEPFLVASATIGIIAQRLVRRLCRSCRQPYTPDAETLQYLGWSEPQAPEFHRAVGCQTCHGTGFKGRVGIYEVLRLHHDLRKHVLAGADATNLHDAAVAHGMMDLRHYALYLLEQGETTVEEVLSVVVVSE
jgi:type IV pilus assembly protein PilB